jgi:hypothetical protein
MVILITILPGYFALQPSQNAGSISRTVKSSRYLLATLTHEQQLVSGVAKNPGGGLFIRTANASETTTNAVIPLTLHRS